MKEKRTFEEVQKEILELEKETNSKIIQLLTSCNEKVGIRVLNTVFPREERESAFPLQLDTASWDRIYPNGLSESFLNLNSFNLFGG